MELNNFNDPTSLKEVFQGLIPDGLGVIQGKVTSVSPLKIQVVNDDKLILSENIICLPRHLSTYKTTVDIALGGGISSVTGTGQGSHSHGGGEHDEHISGSGGHSHSGDGLHTHALVTYAITGASMTVYNGLKVGDTVYILSFNQGKKYYILDRRA